MNECSGDAITSPLLFYLQHVATVLNSFLEAV
jgi:hypothetical protein